MPRLSTQVWQYSHRFRRTVQRAPLPDLSLHEQSVRSLQRLEKDSHGYRRLGPCCQSLRGGGERVRLPGQNRAETHSARRYTCEAYSHGSLSNSGVLLRQRYVGHFRGQRPRNLFSDGFLHCRFSTPIQRQFFSNIHPRPASSPCESHRSVVFIRVNNSTVTRAYQPLIIGMRALNPLAASKPTALSLTMSPGSPQEAATDAALCAQSWVACAVMRAVSCSPPCTTIRLNDLPASAVRVLPQGQTGYNNSTYGLVVHIAQHQ